MKLGSRQKVVNSVVVDDESRSDAASDARATSPSMRRMFLMENPLSSFQSSNNSSGLEGA
jgi:hypothetical protein